MALSKSSIIDVIEIMENGIIQVRRADIIRDNGKEAARTYHRHCLVPGADLSKEHPRVVAQANAAWTPQVIAAFEATLQQEPV